MKKIILFLVISLPLTLHSLSLNHELRLLKEAPHLQYDELRLLAYLYIFNGNYSKASSLLKKLYTVKSVPNFKLDAAIALTVIKSPDAFRVWSEYFKIPLKSRSGKRWDKMGKMLQEIYVRQTIQDEDAFLDILKGVYLGRGYYTAVMLIDIYLKYGGLTYRKDLEMLKGDVFYFAKFYDKAEEVYTRIYQTQHKEVCLIKMAKISYKQLRYEDAIKYLEGISQQELKRFNYYYLYSNLYLLLGETEKFNKSLDLAISYVTTYKQLDKVKKLKKES